MALGKVWVLAETQEGKVASITLELLAKARELGDTVEAFHGGDGSAVAGELGAHGATKVYATGDLGGAVPGVAVAAAMAAQIEAGNAPDLILLGTTYDGRDIAARLSVALDRPVITNTTELSVDGSSVVCEEPIFGGTQIVRTRFTGDGPYLVLVRPKSFSPEETRRRPGRGGVGGGT